MSWGGRMGVIRFGVVAVGALGLWLAGAYLLAPSIIRAAYEGRSFGFINGLIGGQEYHPVERYLAAGRELARLGTVSLVAGFVLLFLGLRFRDSIGRGLQAVFRRPPQARLGQLALSAAGLGIAFGLVEAGLSWIRFRNELTTFNNPDMFWLAPLALAALFVALTLLAYVVTGGVKEGLSRRFVIALCVAVGVLSVLRAMRLGLHPAAIWLVSIGLGVQLARISEGRALLWRRIERVTIPAVVLLGIVPLVFFPHDKRFGVTPGVPTAERSGGPNVLLLVLDTVRGESLGTGGYARATSPNLDRLAQHGVIFDRAIAPSPWTLPSHASMFTGRYPHELDVAWDRGLSESFPTLAEALGARGYARGGFVGNTTNAGRGTGLERGFDIYVDYPRSMGTWIASVYATRRLADVLWPRLPLSRASAHRRYAPEVGGELLDWVDGLDGESFFGFVNYMDAHAPYEMHSGFTFDPSKRARIFGPAGRLRAAAGSLAADIDAYDSSIAFIDHHVGSLIGGLRERGLLDNTLIIVTSDHGEQLGERGLMDHGNSLYSQLLVVPLVLYWPGGLPEGLRIDQPVSLRDLGATIEELSGLDAPTLPGESLVRWWAGDETARARAVLSEVRAAPHAGFEAGPSRLGDMKSIVSGVFQYILNGDGSEELFDLAADPRGRVNLADTEVGVRELGRMRALLDEALVIPEVAGSVPEAAGGSQ